MNRLPNPHGAKTVKPPRHSTARAARQQKLLGAFEEASNRARAYLWAKVQPNPVNLRPVKAGIYAAQVVAALLGCSLEQAAEHWLDVALRSAETPLVDEEQTLEKRLVTFAAQVSAFVHLTHAGHPPDAILQAVSKVAQSNHDFFDEPDVLPLFQAAVKRHWGQTPA